ESSIDAGMVQVGVPLNVQPGTIVPSTFHWYSMGPTVRQFAIEFLPSTVRGWPSQMVASEPASAVVEQELGQAWMLTWRWPVVLPQAFAFTASRHSSTAPGVPGSTVTVRVAGLEATGPNRNVFVAVLPARTSPML